jgi:hypothetical protein
MAAGSESATTPRTTTTLLLTVSLLRFLLAFETSSAGWLGFFIQKLGYVFGQWGDAKFDDYPSGRRNEQERQLAY